MNKIIVEVNEEQIRTAVRDAVREVLMSTQAQYFNKKDAAKYLKISPVCLWNYEKQGYLKPVRVGDRMVFTREQLDKFAQGRK